MSWSRASLHPLARLPREPRSCTWELTRRCNLRCIHCENNCGAPSARELSPRRMYEVAAELVALGCERVNVTGGEPLLHPDWDGLCRHLVALGTRVALITNGTLLDDQHLERVLAAGVATLGISLDGLQAVHDRIRPRAGDGPSPWASTVAAIERAVPRIDTVAITAVNRLNLGELPALRDTLLDLGVRRWQVQLVVPVGRARNVPAPFLLAPAELEGLTAFLAEARARPDALQVDVTDTIGYFTERELGLRGRPGEPTVWTGCQAGLRVVAITYDGKVRGCSMLPPEFDAGSLHEEALTTIWRDAERFAYSTRFDATHLAGTCGRCAVGPLCRAGCTTMAYWTTGTVYNNPFCLQRVRGACP